MSVYQIYSVNLDTHTCSIMGTHVLGYRPLVVIQYLPNREERVRRERMLKQAIIAAITVLIAAIVAIHFLYMPLNILFVKILARLV